MRVIRRFFLILILLLVGVAIWGAIYAQKKGFTRTWRELVEGEFAKRGYYVDIGKLTLGPFQGLVAEDVRFFQDPQRRRELAFVDNVILDLDLSDVLNRDLSVNTLDVQDASLTLPLTPGRRDSELLQVNRFSARLVVTESQIEVVRAQAEVAGFAVSMKGSLYRPPLHVAPVEVTEAELEEQRQQLLEIRRRLDRVQRVIDELGRFEFSPDDPPRLEIEFAGDLADLAHLNATVRLAAPEFRRGAYTVEQLDAQAEYDGESQLGVIKELHLRDALGDLRLRCDWEVSDKTVDFELESSADLPGMIAAIWPNPKLGEVVFFSPPRVRAEGTIRLDELGATVLPRVPMEVVGELRSERFGSRGAVFDGMEMQFSVSGGRYYVRNLRLDHKSGLMLANLMYDPARTEDRFRYQSEIRLDPEVLMPFVTSERTKHFLSDWQFDDSSAVYFAALGEGPSLDPETWNTRGVIDLRQFRRRSVPFDHLETEYASVGPVHEFRNLSVERPEGRLTAGLVRHHVEERTWETEDLRSTLDLYATLRAVAPSVAKSLEAFRFSHPPEVRMHGLVDRREPSEDPAAPPPRHDFELSFASEQPATFEFLGRPLPLAHPAGKVRASEGKLRLTEFEAGLFGGTARATFETDRLESDGAFRSTLSAEGLDYGELLRLYGNSERRADGRWSGDLALSGKLGEHDSWSGQGAVRLRDGDLLALPAFSPVIDNLLQALAALKRVAAVGNEPASPGDEPGESVPSKPDPAPVGASADLEISEGVVSVLDLRSTSETLRLTGGGTIDSASRAIAIDLSVAWREDPRVGLGIEARGPLSAPKWRLKLPVESR